MRRREFIAGLGSAPAWPLAARAQQGDRVRRVGALLAGGKDSPVNQSAIAALRERLAMLGWVEGGNLLMDYRFIMGDPGRAAAYAKELVGVRRKRSPGEGWVLRVRASACGPGLDRWPQRADGPSVARR